MRRMKSTSSSPQPESGSRQTGRLVWVPTDLLRPHPANPNRMSEEFLEKLAANISQENDYEPLTARPHPTKPGFYQILGGHQRAEALRRLGHEKALCYLWPCDDRTALLLLATLNRLQGEDEPLLRAQLLAELVQVSPPEELASFLPEDEAALRNSLQLLDLDLDELLADLQEQSHPGSGLRAITFAVTPEDEAAIEEAVRQVAAGLEGANRRGRALALIARDYIEGRSA